MANCGCIDTTPCGTQECGCKFEVDAGCVRYTGDDLSCLNASSGDRLSDILLELNNKFCNLVEGNYIEVLQEPIGANCAEGGLKIVVKDISTSAIINTEYLCASAESFVQSVTGLNTDNTDPLNPIVEISVDGKSITGLGTPASPLICHGSIGIASSTELGGIMVGTGLSISETGVLSTTFVESNPLITGNTLYVSPNGSDADLTRAGHLGKPSKPFLTTYAAKNAAISGDTIYVFSQTFTYNNSDALGNLWNNRQDEINLWKNGVTWYFEPNCKVRMTNQTITGQNLYLVKPVGGIAGDTCRILGYLEFESYGLGADTYNGYSFYFDGTPIGTDYGYTFYSESLSITTNTNQPIQITRSAILASGFGTNITIKLDTININTLSGQSGSATAIYLSGSDADLNFNLIFREGLIYRTYIFILKNLTTRSIVNIKGDKISNSNKRVLAISNCQNLININIKEIYYGINVLGGYPSVLSDDSTCAYTLNLTGNLIEYQANSVSGQLLFQMYGTVGSTLNYVGDIYTNQISGTGRTIVWTQFNNNTVNITGNINYMGTATTTSTAFIAMGGDKVVINFIGKIRGNFGAILAKPYNGTINIDNSNIKSTATNTTFSLMDNQGYTIQGNVNIRNSYIEMSSTSNFSNGSYIKAFINNSTIVNTGTGGGLSNITAFGSLQLLNSTIIISAIGATSIYYTGIAPVVSSNTSTNKTYNINTFYGNIDTVTEITI